MTLGLPRCRGRDPTRLRSRHEIAQLQRMVDAAQRLNRLAGAANDDVAIIEQAARDALDDVDALDLVHMHLDRAAMNKTGLVDDPPVGHCHLGDPAPEPSLRAPK